MAIHDSIRPTRRALLAGAAALPAAPALALPTLDTRGRVRGGQLAHLANNLRRADDMARTIDAPLDTVAAWRWIANHARIADDLEPLDRAELIADLEDLTYPERQALRREAMVG